ncbi:MAG: DUF1330 domain-containing protein [Maricaulaceae bacterium]
MMLNALDPTPEQIKAFLVHKGADQPVYMLNLLKFKVRATYKDGEDVSGREAYSRYAKAFGEMVRASGHEASETTFGGSMNAVLIGDANGGDASKPDWDAVALVKYPNAKTMFEMVSSDEYRKIHYHRRAGLEGQLLISCDDGGVF